MLIVGCLRGPTFLRKDALPERRRAHIDEEAHKAFEAIRWADNGAEPYCPKCGCLDARKLSTRPVWKCQGCRYQFSVTAGTIFAAVSGRSAIICLPW